MEFPDHSHLLFLTAASFKKQARNGDIKICVQYHITQKVMAWLRGLIIHLIVIM